MYEIVDSQRNMEQDNFNLEVISVYANVLAL